MFLWIQIHRGLKALWSEEGPGTRGTSMCREEGRRGGEEEGAGKKTEFSERKENLEGPLS